MTRSDGSHLFVQPQDSTVSLVSGLSTASVPGAAPVSVFVGRNSYFVEGEDTKGPALSRHLLAPGGLANLGDDTFSVIDYYPGFAAHNAVNVVSEAVDGTFDSEVRWGFASPPSNASTLAMGVHLRQANLRSLSQFDPDGKGFLIVESGKLYSSSDLGYPIPYPQFSNVSNALRLADGGIAIIHALRKRLSILLVERFEFLLFENTFEEFEGLAHDGGTQLFFTEGKTRTVHVVDLRTNERRLLAGAISENPEPNNINVGAPCEAAQFREPTIIRHAVNGDLFVADGQATQRIRQTPTCIVDTLTAPSLEQGVLVGTPLRLNSISGLALTRAGDLMVSDVRENSLIHFRF
jgi:hypothetical protein